MYEIYSETKVQIIVANRKSHEHWNVHTHRLQTCFSRQMMIFALVFLPCAVYSISSKCLKQLIKQRSVKYDQWLGFWQPQPCTTMTKLNCAMQNKWCGLLTSRVFLLHDNVRCHSAIHTENLIKSFEFPTDWPLTVQSRFVLLLKRVY